MGLSSSPKAALFRRKSDCQTNEYYDVQCQYLAAWGVGRTGKGQLSKCGAGGSGEKGVEILAHRFQRCW